MFKEGLETGLKSDLLQNMDDKRVAFLIQIDFSPAFNTIDNRILIDELNRNMVLKAKFEGRTRVYSRTVPISNASNTP